MIDLDALSAKIHHESSWIDSPTLRDLDAAVAELREERRENQGLRTAIRALENSMAKLYGEREASRKEHRAAEAELHVLLDDLRAARKVVENIRTLVDEQAEDEGLWFEAATAPEAYLQQELRRLHEAVERAIPTGIGGKAT